MQLNKDRQVRLGLAAATGMLLGGQAAQAGDWSYDSQLLYYSEPDRVTAIEPVVAARWERGDGEAMSFKLTVDSLTGASASGATPATSPQTFTTPSGHGTYQVQAGETPLDPTFLDTRWALSTSWEKQLSPLWRSVLGANLSTEYDYQSIAASGTLARDFRQRNTTLSLGLSVGYDQVEPVGGLPAPLAPMSPEVGDDQAPTGRLGDNDDKTLYDLLLGVTQVLDPSSLVQVNYSIGRSSGYLTDPYKLVSVVDSGPGASQGDPVATLYEARPDTRTKQSLFLAYKRRLARSDVVDVSYRYHWDDWEVRSHTLDFRYRWKLSERSYVQPHLRLYQQSAAELYNRFLVDGEPLPAFASADYRLGELTGVTVGLKYARPRADEREWNVKLEYYSQSGQEPDFQPGALEGFDLFPTVEALMVQFGVSF